MITDIFYFIIHSNRLTYFGCKAYAGEDRSVKISCNIVSTSVSRETYAYSLKFNSEGGSQIDDVEEPTPPLTVLFPPAPYTSKRYSPFKGTKKSWLDPV